MKDGTDNYLYLEDYNLSGCDNNPSSTNKLSSEGTCVGTIVNKHMEKARKVMVESNIPVDFLSQYHNKISQNETSPSSKIDIQPFTLSNNSIESIDSKS